MPPTRRLTHAAVLTALLPTGASALAIWYALTSHAWAAWGVGTMPRRTPASTSFADLANITATADCLLAQLPIEGCDPYGRPFQPYVVPPARLLALAGWGTAQIGPLGLLLALCTTLTVAALALFIARGWRRGIGRLWLAQSALALLAISPPVMLAVERGQIEQATLGLVLVSVVLLRRDTIGAWGGALLSLAATASKYFCVGMFLPFARLDSWRQRRWPVLLAMAASGVFLLSSIPEIRQAVDASRAGTPQTARAAFGLASMLATMLSPSPVGVEPPPAIAAWWGTLHLVGLALLLLLVVMSAAAMRRTALRLPSPVATTLLLGGGGVPALPYMLGTSHDYRLLFLLPVAAGCAQWIGETPDGAPPPLPVAIIGLSLGAAWGGTSMVFGAGQAGLPHAVLVLGDLALLMTMALVLALWAHVVRSDVQTTPT